MGTKAIALYDTGANMICMFFICYIKFKTFPPLLNIQALPVHSELGLMNEEPNVGLSRPE